MVVYYWLFTKFQIPKMLLSCLTQFYALTLSNRPKSINYYCYLYQLLYILNSIQVLHTPNAGQVFIFNIFCAKKLKQCKIRNNFGAHFSKKAGFLICTKTLVECFIPRIRRFWPVFGMRSTPTLFKIYNNQQSEIELIFV